MPSISNCQVNVQYDILLFSNNFNTIKNHNVTCIDFEKNQYILKDTLVFLALT